jgi:hypothetical protein
MGWVYTHCLNCNTAMPPPTREEIAAQSRECGTCHEVSDHGCGELSELILELFSRIESLEEEVKCLRSEAGLNKY